MIFGSCQSLLSEMRDVTIQVAANILEADATKCEPRILEQQIQTLGKLKSLFFFLCSFAVPSNVDLSDTVLLVLRNLS